MLYSPAGTPLNLPPPGPSPQTEALVNAELQKLDTLLHIRWLPIAAWNAAQQRYEGRYALCCFWPDIDKRRQWVRDGTHDPNEAYDSMGWFCDDIMNANSLPREPMAVMHKVLELLGSADNTRVPWAARMRSTIAHNAERKEQVRKRAAEIAGRAIEQLAGIKSFAGQQSHSSDPHDADYDGVRRELEQQLNAEFGADLAAMEANSDDRG
jgi:hypothetical protein